MPETALLLLAAGASVRMGAAKQLLEFRGEPLIRHTAHAALAARCGPVLVVLGANHQQITPALSGLDVGIVLNDRWAEGIGTSIQAGLAALGTSPLQGVILALADQPFITPWYLRGLVGLHQQTGRRIIASRYAGTVGVPVFFAGDLFPLLLALPPQEGCKGVILRNEPDTLLVDCPDAAIDIDTPEDYAIARASGRKGE